MLQERRADNYERTAHFVSFPVSPVLEKHGMIALTNSCWSAGWKEGCVERSYFWEQDGMEIVWAILGVFGAPLPHSPTGSGNP